MTQVALAQLAEEPPKQKPLNPRQHVFARELGIAIASGSRDLTEAYRKAGFKPDRGNASRLASDPRIRDLAEAQCKEALRLNGVHIGYLQAKLIEMLHTAPTKLHRLLAEIIDSAGQMKTDLSAEKIAEIDAAMWPLSELRVGEVTIKLPDKKGIIELLAKQLGFGNDSSKVSVGTARDTDGNERTVIEVVTGVPRAPDEATGGNDGG